jgi:hypothetical protein
MGRHGRGNQRMSERSIALGALAVSAATLVVTVGLLAVAVMTLDGSGAPAGVGASPGVSPDPWDPSWAPTLMVGQYDGRAYYWLVSKPV